MRQTSRYMLAYVARFRRADDGVTVYGIAIVIQLYRAPHNRAFMPREGDYAVYLRAWFSINISKPMRAAFDYHFLRHQMPKPVEDVMALLTALVCAAYHAVRGVEGELSNHLHIIMRNYARYLRHVPTPVVGVSIYLPILAPLHELIKPIVLVIDAVVAASALEDEV